ncbi:MAG: hypothetical protein WD872_05160 [Pirellulaceae bacterium]
MINHLRTNLLRAVPYLLSGVVLLFAQVALAVEPAIDDEPEKQILTDSKRISAWEINEFHRRFVALCMQDLPDAVTVQYIGAVATDNGRLKLRVEDDAQKHRFPLSWHVVRDVVLFEFWISTKKTTATVSKCQIDGRTIYVNVSFVDKDRDVKAPLTALGGASVQSVLQKLALPGPTAPVRDPG